MGKSMTTNNGNDRVMTPIKLASEIVAHYKPEGRILEPCCGEGNFLVSMPTADWCEIDKGRDFLEVTGHWDWIITNPPYSKYRSFFNKAMDVADNVVFLQFINAIFFKARLRDMKQHGFRIKEIWCFESPKEFPKFGFQMGCVYYKRGYTGEINFIN